MRKIVGFRRGDVVRIADDAKYNEGCYADVLECEDIEGAGGQLLTLSIPQINASPHETLFSSNTVQYIGHRNPDVPQRKGAKA